MRYFARNKLLRNLVHKKIFSLIWQVVFNPLMHNDPRWSDTLKNLAAFAARFLKCVGSFYNIA